jgi:protein-disulfide isomerase
MPIAFSPFARFRRQSSRDVSLPRGGPRRLAVLVGWGTLLLLKVAVATATGVEGGHDPRLGPPFAQRDRPSLGSERAAVVVVEISSFKCSHCRAFHEQTFPRLREQYIASGRVQWVLLNAADDPAEEFSPVFPLARCALRQGKFWEVLDALFQAGNRGPSLQRDLIAKHPLLDRSALADCERDRMVRQEVAADFAEYRALLVRGTPTYLVQAAGRDGARTRVTIAGAQSLEYFQRVLDEVLAASPEGSTHPRVPTASK